MPQLSAFLCNKRLRDSTVRDRPSSLEEFHSDHSRILFSSSFRHMVQKTQVFPLEPNTAVRNRLTHSLEVADIGKTLARRVAKCLVEDGRATPEDGQALEVVISNACILHDIGNPPFGHFGERAIQMWFQARYRALLGDASAEPTDGIAFDLRHFDGNPQGFRIATFLHNELRDTNGLNLTAATLLSCVKYPSTRGHKPREAADGLKLGVFSTEEQTWLKACSFANHNPDKRFLLTYLMEAADDICYCTSDISDAIKKRLITPEKFKELFESEWKAGQLPDALKDINRDTHFPTQVAVTLSRQAIAEVAEYFCEHLDRLADEGRNDNLLENTRVATIYRTLKTVAKKHIYTSDNVQRIEIAGYSIVKGLLDRLEVLTTPERDTFWKYVSANEQPEGDSHKLAWRVFGLLGKRVKNAFRDAHNAAVPLSDRGELLLRYRMIVDYVAGLTDQHALSLHQLFTGSSL